jgi:hypothetical protein
MGFLATGAAAGDVSACSFMREPTSCKPAPPMPNLTEAITTWHGHLSRKTASSVMALKRGRLRAFTLRWIWRPSMDAATALYNVIERGRYGTQMAAYGVDEGGVLSAKQY